MSMNYDQYAFLYIRFLKLNNNITYGLILSLA